MVGCVEPCFGRTHFVGVPATLSWHVACGCELLWLDLLVLPGRSCSDWCSWVYGRDAMSSDGGRAAAAAGWQWCGGMCHGEWLGWRCSLPSRHVMVRGHEAVQVDRLSKWNPPRHIDGPPCTLVKILVMVCCNGVLRWCVVLACLADARIGRRSPAPFSNRIHLYICSV